MSVLTIALLLAACVPTADTGSPVEDGEPQITVGGGPCSKGEGKAQGSWEEPAPAGSIPVIAICYDNACRPTEDWVVSDGILTVQGCDAPSVTSVRWLK